MSFAITCPSCSSRYAAPDHLRGQTVQCPSCSNSFIAEDPAARAPTASAASTATAAVRSAQATAASPKATAASTFVTCCTHCGQRFSAPGNVYGRMVRCPGCSQSFNATPVTTDRPVQQPSAAPASKPDEWKWFEENFEPYKPPTIQKEEKRKPQISLQSSVFETQPKRLRMASRLSRLAAAIIDALLIWGVAFFVLFASVASISQVTSPGEEISEQQARELATVLGIFYGWICLMGLVNLICLAARGQTLGKMALGIKIVGSDGHPCFGRILGIRIIGMGILKMVPFVGLIDVLMIFRDNQRCMHDELADTIVVRAR